MKAVIVLSGLAGLVIFGPPVLRSRVHHHDVSVIVHEAVRHEVGHGEGQFWDQSECRFEAQRRFSQTVGSGETLRLLAGSGSLEVVGVEGLSEVRAVGRACASHEEVLEEIQLTGEMRGSALTLETHHPDWNGWRNQGNRYGRLDLRVEVPAGMGADIQDGSGEAELSNLGDLVVKDGSGGLTIHDMAGEVSIEDGSGELQIRGVDGFLRIHDGSGEIYLEGAGSDVEIEDSSGELSLRDIGGGLTLTDSSGEIDVQGVGGTVRVIHDSSGSIQVEGVGGDFIVDRDGSGSIEYAEVVGAVKIPKKRRER